MSDFEGTSSSGSADTGASDVSGDYGDGDGVNEVESTTDDTSDFDDTAPSEGEEISEEDDVDESESDPDYDLDGEESDESESDVDDEESPEEGTDSDDYSGDLEGEEPEDDESGVESTDDEETDDGFGDYDEETVEDDEESTEDDNSEYVNDGFEETDSEPTEESEEDNTDGYEDELVNDGFEDDETEEDSETDDEVNDEVDDETEEDSETDDEVNDEVGDETDEESETDDEVSDEVGDETDEESETDDEVSDEVDDETEEDSETDDEVNDEVDDETEEDSETDDEVNDEVDDETEEDFETDDEVNDEVGDETDEESETDDEVSDEVDDETEEDSETDDEVNDEVDDETEEDSETDDETEEDSETDDEVNDEVDDETDEKSEDDENVNDKVDGETEKMPESNEDSDNNIDENEDKDVDTAIDDDKTDGLTKNAAYKEAEAVSEQDKAFDKLKDYMYSHNYGPDDYATYSQDPEWRQLHKDAFPDHELPPLSQEAAFDQLKDYMYSHDYGPDDFGTYSKDPQWRELHRAAFPDYKPAPLNDGKPMGKIEGLSYNQGENDLGFNGTCGPTTISNALTRLTGNQYTENEVLEIAVDNRLCDVVYDELDDCGGTTTNDVVNIIEMVKSPDDNIKTEVCEYGNAPHMNQLAERLKDDNTVAIVGVDSATLWDKRGDVTENGMFCEASDHWIMADSPVYDSAGELQGFNIVDSGGGKSYVSADKFEKMYVGDNNHKISDPTAIFVSKTESDVSTTGYRSESSNGSGFSKIASNQTESDHVMPRTENGENQFHELTDDQKSELKEKLDWTDKQLSKCTVDENGVIRYRTDCHYMEGKTGDHGVSYERKTVDVHGTKVDGVFPVFDSAYDVQLPEHLERASNDRQFRECNTQLRIAVQNDPELKSRFTDKQLESIVKRETPEGMVWHHSEETGKMQLVKVKDHDRTKGGAAHTGGKAIWGGGYDS